MPGSIFPHKANVEGLLGVVREPGNKERTLPSKFIEIVAHVLNKIEILLLLISNKLLFLHLKLILVADWGQWFLVLFLLQLDLIQLLLYTCWFRWIYLVLGGLESGLFDLLFQYFI